MSGASRMTVAATGAATTIFVARLLGPDGAGGYAVAQSLIALLTVATTLGVEHGIAYYVSARRWGARDAQRAAQRVALVTGVLGAGAGALARILVPSAFADLALIPTLAAAAALPFALSWFYFTYVALAVDRYEAYVLPPAAQSMTALVLVTTLGAAFGLSGAVIGFALAHALTAAAVLLLARRTTSRADARLVRPLERPLRSAIRFGIKGYAANALQMLNYRLDVFVLAAVASAADVGHYSVAIAVTSVMWLLPAALGDVLFPRVAALSARGKNSDEMRAFVEAKSMRHTVVITGVSTAILALALLLLVVPVYGPAFRPAIDLGLILLPGVALVALVAPLSAMIVGRGRPGYSLVTALVTTPLTIALYLLLIPPLDATGAALASTISYGCNFILALFFYRRITGTAVLPLLIPTRSEIADYVALAPTLVSWASGRWRRLTAR